jgi:hypothetical protein
MVFVFGNSFWNFKNFPVKATSYKEPNIFLYNIIPKKT